MTPTARRAFPFDSRMPELPRALDAATVGPLLRDHLFTTPDRSADVDDCRIVRISYRPEVRCLVQYAVAVRDTLTGCSSNGFVCGMLYGDPTRAARRPRRVPEMAFIPELRMLARVFPADGELPQARALMSADDPQLRAAVLNVFGSGSWTVNHWATEVVRYRCGLSLVVRYTVSARRAATGDVRTRVLYAKAYPDHETARRTFTCIDQLGRRSANTDVGCRIDRPVACLGHLGTVILPSTAGRPLTDIIATADNDEAIGAVALSARALAAFNQSDAPTNRQYRAAEYVRSIRRRVGILKWALPELAPHLDRILDSVCGLSDIELRPTHCDMKPEHVFIGRGGPTFIDLDSCAAADPILDVALMLARFAALAVNDAKRPFINSLASTFGQEYFSRAPSAWRARLPRYYAASLVEVAAGLFHRQEDGWRLHVPKLIAAATRVPCDQRHCSADTTGCLLDPI